MCVPNSSENQSHENASAYKAAQESGHDPKGGLSAANGNHGATSTRQLIGELIVACGFATGLWVFGEHLENHNHPITGGIVNFTAADLFFATVPLIMLKIWPKQTVCIWSLFGIFSVLLAFVWIISASEHLNPPKIVVTPFEFRQKHKEVYVLLGGNNIILPPVPPGMTAFKDIGRAFLGAGTHEHPSQIQLVADENRVFLNIQFAPIFGMPLLELTNNELGGLPAAWDFNHRSNAMEIVNEKLVPILQFYYKDDTHLVLTGAITYINESTKGAVLVSETGFEIMTKPDFTDDEFVKHVEALHLKRIFKYPAWKYPGQFDENSN